MKTLIILLMVFPIPVFGAPHNNRCYIDNQIEGSVTNTSAVFLVASTNRSCLIINNKSVSNPIYIETVASTSTTSGIRIGPYESYSPPFIFSNQLYVHVSTNTQTAPISIFSGVAIP